jgi:hypothetical protein
MDLRPVLVPTVLLEHFRRITIVDYGWGTVGNVKVSAHVAIGSRDGSDYSIDVGTFVGSAEADLTPAFRRAGFDIAALRRWERGPRGDTTPAAYRRELAAVSRALTPFGLDPERNVEVPVKGEISYSQGRAGAPRLVRFSARVPATHPLGLGDYQPPTARYRAVQLATDDRTYERRVPLSQSVRAGSTDRFEILVYAARSSRHDLRIRLVYGNGESILSQPIRLDLFVPRNP